MIALDLGVGAIGAAGTLSQSRSRANGAPSQQSFFLDRLSFRNRQDLEANFRQIVEAEFMCSNLRYIDYSSANERATIGDPHDCRMPVFLIVDADQCPEREKTSVFRWNGTHYSLVSGDSSGEKYFVIHAFDGNDLLIEATYENDNVYLLARKQAKGTYRILPIDQNGVDEATRIRTCVTRNPIICIIQTRQQLDTFVRAAAAKTGGYITVGVISAAGR